MKRTLVLTSLLALAACGGGGGGSISGGGTGGGSGGGTPFNPVAPVTPAGGVALQSFTDGQGAVNADNAELTNMASFTATYTGGSSIENEIKTYVNNLLGNRRGGILNANSRAASNRVARDSDPEFAEADTRITNMKQVLFDMTNLSGAELTEYVTNNQDAVKEAFVLWTNNTNTVSDETTVADLIAAFGGFGLTEDNVMTQFDAFDTNNFHFSKEYMDEVKLRDTGQDAYFKFDMDEGGAITTVSLWENPTSEYGSSYADNKIVIENGAAVIKNDSNLNPFDADYLNSDAGYLVRNGTAFSNEMHHYEFDLGEHNLGSGAAIDEDEFEEVAIDNPGALTVDAAKQKLKDYIIAKVNNKLHNQHGGESPANLESFRAVADYYIAHIDEIVTAEVVNNSDKGTFTQTATMNGVGKDVGLKYADFGYSTMVRDMGEYGTETQYLTYVGGYDARRMDNTVVNGDLDGATFTGTAIVTVEDEHKGNNDDKHAALYKDTTATLKYEISGDKAKHTLTMNRLQAVRGASENSDWYKMVVSGTEENPTLTMKFDAAGKNIDENYRFFKVTDGVVSRDQDVVATDGTAVNIDMFNGTPGAGAYANNYRLHGSAAAEYYGQDPNNPSEATVGFSMTERYHSNDNNIQHELSVYGAFGGTK